MSEESMKVLGRRVRHTGGVEIARDFLKLVIKLRGTKPFIPKGVHRFTSFEESNQWSLKMMARNSNPDRRP
jgi:hypothetical protein